MESAKGAEMTDYAKDMEVIEKATQGPWDIVLRPNGTRRVEDKLGLPILVNHNMEYVAHFNPSKCRELIDTIQRLEKRVGELEVKSKCDDVRVSNLRILVRKMKQELGGIWDVY